MAEIIEGNVQVTISDNIEIPEKAGTLSASEIRSYAKPRRGIGLASFQVASDMEKSNFEVPGVTPESLRKYGQMAEDIDQVIADAEVILAKLKQANTIIDDKAYELLRRVNDQVKSSAKFDSSVKERFASIFDYFKGSKKGE